LGGHLKARRIYDPADLGPRDGFPTLLSSDFGLVANAFSVFAIELHDWLTYDQFLQADTISLSTGISHKRQIGRGLTGDSLLPILFPLPLGSLHGLLDKE
jgi:hypothetical protein